MDPARRDIPGSSTMTLAMESSTFSPGTSITRQQTQASTMAMEKNFSPSPKRMMKATATSGSPMQSHGSSVRSQSSREMVDSSSLSPSECLEISHNQSPLQLQHHLQHQHQRHSHSHSQQVSQTQTKWRTSTTSATMNGIAPSCLAISSSPFQPHLLGQGQRTVLGGPLANSCGLLRNGLNGVAGSLLWPT